LASTTRKLTARPFSVPVMRNLSLQPHCIDQVGRQAHTTGFFPRVIRRQDLTSISVSSSEIGFDDIHTLLRSPCHFLPLHRGHWMMFRVWTSAARRT
jgi:hypothetical protein